MIWTEPNQDRQLLEEGNGYCSVKPRRVGRGEWAMKWARPEDGVEVGVTGAGFRSVSLGVGGLVEEVPIKKVQKKKEMSLALQRRYPMSFQPPPGSTSTPEDDPQEPYREDPLPQPPPPQYQPQQPLKEVQISDEALHVPSASRRSHTDPPPRQPSLPRRKPRPREVVASPAPWNSGTGHRLRHLGEAPTERYILPAPVCNRVREKERRDKKERAEKGGFFRKDEVLVGWDIGGLDYGPVVMSVVALCGEEEEETAAAKRDRLVLGKPRKKVSKVTPPPRPVTPPSEVDDGLVASLVTSLSEFLAGPAPPPTQLDSLLEEERRRAERVPVKQRMLLKKKTAPMAKQPPQKSSPISFKKPVKELEVEVVKVEEPPVVIRWVKPLK